MTDVLIVGAGIMGSAIARELARAGLSVRVLEKSIPGAEASSVAAGILAPLVEHGVGPLRTLGVASREAYVDLAAALKDELGADIGFTRSGVVTVSMNEREGDAISGDEARRLEPALADAIRSARVLPDEAQVDPPRLLTALVQSAERAGAKFTSGAAVRGLVRRGDRIVGVETDRETVHAAHVVLAAGAWTSLVPGLPRVLAGAVRPVRGQLLRASLRAPITKRIVFAADAYLVPRLDGRVIVGATMEDVGFTKEVTLGAVGRLAASAVAVLPALAHARFLEADVSFRPASIDGLPLIGPSGLDGLWLASGHFRNGILLAPSTATILTSQIAGTACLLDAHPFDPRRLGDSA